jgi:multidrug efflux pump subunit AcrB
MRVWVGTDRLTGLGLTTGDIINAIKSQNVQAAVGRVGAPPISNEQQLQLNIQTQGRLARVARATSRGWTVEEVKKRWSRRSSW